MKVLILAALLATASVNASATSTPENQNKSTRNIAKGGNARHIIELSKHLHNLGRAPASILAMSQDSGARQTLGAECPKTTDKKVPTDGLRLLSRD